jgi:tocopherol O-methyltransferase
VGNYLEDVVAYFEQKTQSILERYGPGPRVHYHTGILDEPPRRGASKEELRQALVNSQKTMLHEAASLWEAPRRLSGEILDVGCGLGGGSLFWAEEFGAQVTALTCTPSHVPFVQRFAAEVGVADSVRTVVGDASAFEGKECFDAVVAVDASGYLPRETWFARVAALLRPGGAAFVIDCFLEDPTCAEIFDRHWRTRIGTLDEYCAAAAKAGLKLGESSDVSARTTHFWTTTLALIDLEASDTGADPVRVAVSRRAHAFVRDGLANGGFRYSMLTFEKKAARRRRSGTLCRVEMPALVEEFE